MRGAMAIVLVGLSGCSLIVPGPDDFTYDGEPDASATDGGSRDAGPDFDGAARDAGPMNDAGPDAGCAASETLCGGTCVDTQTSVEHCGRCDAACDTGWVCREGDCFDPPVRVAAGPAHTCTVRGSGRVFCWGRNFSGQLGNDSVFDSASPVEVEGIADASDVSAGGDTFGDPEGATCALRSRGDVTCWGRENGVFGDGVDRLIPEAAAVPPAQFLDQSFALGCALTSARRPYCWGQLLASGPVEAPHEVTALGISGPWATSLDTSSLHVCVVATDNRLFCAGRNTSGQLGSPSSVVAETDTLRPVPDVTDAVEVSTSLGGTCFRRSDGTVSCFGGEATLSSGATTLTEHPMPENVAGLTGAAALESGSFGTGTCVIHGDDRLVSCWGMDFPAHGAGGSPGLGAAPYDLAGARGVVDLAVGSSHVCVIMDLAVRCLGGGSYGQLGHGVEEPSATFVNVVLP